MKKLFGLFIVFVLCERLTAATPSAAPKYSDSAGFAEDVGTLVQGLGTAAKFQIYEGLPSQFWEPGAFASERKAKATVQIDDQYFYVIPQVIRPEDVGTLKKLSTVDLFLPPPWPTKACGGFHADFAVRFESGAYVYTALFCFTCGEAIVMRENQSLKADTRVTNFRYIAGLDLTNFKQLRALLFGYRKERPATEFNSDKDQPGAGGLVK